MVGSALVPLIRMIRSYLIFVTVIYYFQYAWQPSGIILARCYLIESLGRFCRTSL